MPLPSRAQDLKVLPGDQEHPEPHHSVNGDPVCRQARAEIAKGEFSLLGKVGGN
jgi:hypothetical protein